MNYFLISYSMILSYVLFSMLKTVSKLVKSTPWVLLRLWVDIRFDNGFWCTDSCTNWFTLAIFRHIQAKNCYLHSPREVLCSKMTSLLQFDGKITIFCKNCDSVYRTFPQCAVWSLRNFCITWNLFREINYKVNSLLKKLFSRKFFKKLWYKNFVNSTVWLCSKVTLLAKISWKWGFY